MIQHILGFSVATQTLGMGYLEERRNAILGDFQAE